MKKLQYPLGILAALCLIIALLITSVELAVYTDYGYFEKEYTKYGVAADVDMEMDDLMVVTREMMAYLRGNRADLHVTTTIGGETREFFNEREIAHMEDVRDLFVGAIWLRYICLGIAALLAALLVWRKTNWKKLLPRCFQIGTVVFFGILGILAALFSSDFTRYFTIFHEIFFSNDLWILNPQTDLLINIVPEPFFIDTALRIALIFGAFILAILAGSTVWLLLQKRKEKRA